MGSEPWTRPFPSLPVPFPSRDRAGSLPPAISFPDVKHRLIRGGQGRASPLSAPQQVAWLRSNFQRAATNRFVRKLEKNTLETELLGPSALLVPATAICRRAQCPMQDSEVMQRPCQVTPPSGRDEVSSSLMPFFHATFSSVIFPNFRICLHIGGLASLQIRSLRAFLSSRKSRAVQGPPSRVDVKARPERIPTDGPPSVVSTRLL